MKNVASCTLVLVILANGMSGNSILTPISASYRSSILQSDEIWNKSNFTLSVGGKDILIIRTDVDYFVETSFQGLYDYEAVRSFVQRNQDYLTYARRTPSMTLEEAILLTACNETFFSELLVPCTFNETDDITDILSTSEITIDEPIDSLKSCLRSVMEQNQTLGLRVVSWSEPHWETEPPFVAFLWSYNYTGASFWCGDAFTTIWSHDNADALLAGIHWEIATYRYIQQSVFPHGPFDVVTSETEIVFSVTPEGEVIKIEAGAPPPLDGASIHPLVPVGGIVLAALCIALVFRWARGRR